MKCKECGKILKQLSFRHLKYCCGLLPYEYKKKYPNEELYDDDIKQKCSFKLDKNPRWKNGISKAKRKCLKCNNIITIRGITGLCTRCTKIGEKNPFFGKKHTLKSLKKMKGWKRPAGKGHHWFGVKRTREQNTKMSKIMKERWKNSSAKYKEKICKHLLKLTNNQLLHKQTRIEKWVEDFLISKNTAFECNKLMYNKFFVDFILKNGLIIETFGDYWHCNPNIYKNSNDYNNMQVCQMKKDALRLAYLKKCGHNVLIIWEHDIKEKPLKVKEIIEANICK